MEPTHNTLHPLTAGFGLAAAVAIIFNTILTWIKETYPSVNAFMKSLLGHHWTTHGVAVVLVFLVCGFVFSHSAAVRRMRAITLTIILCLSTVLAGFGIAGFFLLEIFE